MNITKKEQDVIDRMNAGWLCDGSNAWDSKTGERVPMGLRLWKLENGEKVYDEGHSIYIGNIDKRLLKKGIIKKYRNDGIYFLQWCLTEDYSKASVR